MKFTKRNGVVPGSQLLWREFVYTVRLHSQEMVVPVRTNLINELVLFILAENNSSYCDLHALGYISGFIEKANNLIDENQRL